jgi:hypothetical protein
MNWRVLVLWITITVVTIIVFLIPPIPQSETYHQFVDTRAFGGIHNAFDVASNAFFLIVGLLGMRFVLSDLSAAHSVQRFLDPRERWPYFIFFAGVALTAFGSSYYHLHPDDARLVWDRLPMTLGFMSLLTATLNERINVRTGTLLLVPLLIFGVASVLYWNVTLARDHGDLRPYVLAQFGSLLVLLLLVALFPPTLHSRRGPDRLPVHLRASQSSRSRGPPHFQFGRHCQRPHPEAHYRDCLCVSDFAHAKTSRANQSAEPLDFNYWYPVVCEFELRMEQGQSQGQLRQTRSQF